MRNVTAATRFSILWFVGSSIGAKRLRYKLRFFLFFYFHFSVQKYMYVKIANYLHFYYVFSKILHIEYLKNT